MTRARLPSPGDRIVFIALPGMGWEERGVVTKANDTYIAFRSDLDDVEVMVCREWVRLEEPVQR